MPLILPFPNHMTVGVGEVAIWLYHDFVTKKPFILSAIMLGICLVLCIKVNYIEVKSTLT